MNEHTKHFETKERDPPLRIMEKSYGDSATVHVYVEENVGGDWDTLGVAEISHGPSDIRGLLTDPESEDWSYMEFRASGHRFRVDRRLSVEKTSFHELTIQLEEAREEILGSGHEEDHGWKTKKSWVIQGGPHAD